MSKCCYFTLSEFYKGWEEETYPWLNLETEAPQEDITIRRDDRHILKLYVLRLNDLPPSAEYCPWNKFNRSNTGPLYPLLAFASVFAELTNTFSNLASFTSSIASRSWDTRAVYPASSARSL